MGTETAVPPALCDECGFLLNGVTAADGSDLKPKQGDISICLNCGAPAVLDATLRRRPLGLTDLAKLSTADLSAISAARRACARAWGPDLTARRGNA